MHGAIEVLVIATKIERLRVKPCTNPCVAIVHGAIEARLVRKLELLLHLT